MATTAAMAKMHTLLLQAKANLILQHDEDDELLLGYIAAALDYAENYQHLPEGYYTRSRTKIPASTGQALVMLASHMYESRDGSTAGFFGDNVQAGRQVWDTANRLLAMHKVWKV
jgi:hypothetical protein